jgi:beta-lactam-binding protein with PASTA domain
MTFTERLQWMLRMALMLFILASVAFLSALTAMRYAVQGREVEVPDVIGKPASDAEQILQGRRIGMKIEDRIYSALPVDNIVRQSPPANTTVKTGQFAHVVLSLGPRKETIPILEDRSTRAARIELLQSGMQLGEVSNAYLPGTLDDTVLAQDPSPGTSDVTSPHVDFLVSQGSRPAAYVMPDLGGLPVADATAKLTGSGLKVTKVTSVVTAAAAPNSVIAQTPQRGHRVDANTSIELQIAQTQ